MNFVPGTLSLSIIVAYSNLVIYAFISNMVLMSLLHLKSSHETVSVAMVH